MWSKIVFHQRAATAARLLTEALHLSASAGEDEAREKDGSDLGTEAANAISLRAAKNEMECCRIDDDHDDNSDAINVDDYNCSNATSIAMMAGPVGKHITNIMEDPYNPNFHGNIEFLTWSGTPFKDGQISTHNGFIRTRCRGKNYEVNLN